MCDVITEANEFFNPADVPFEVLGFQEHFDDENGRLLGWRNIGMPDRPTGSPGRREVTLTENLILTKNHKEAIVKASPQRPKKVMGMILIICGPTKD